MTEEVKNNPLPATTLNKDEVALELMRFIASTTGIGKARQSGCRLRRQDCARTTEDQVDALLQLLRRKQCRTVVGRAINSNKAGSGPVAYPALSSSRASLASFSNAAFLASSSGFQPFRLSSAFCDRFLAAFFERLFAAVLSFGRRLLASRFLCALAFFASG